MIRFLTCALMILAIALPPAFAQTSRQPELRLREGNSFEEFDYTYISPWMLKSMQQKDLTELKNIPVGKVQHIEILKTKTNGHFRPFKAIINRLADELELIGYNSDDANGVKICVQTSPSKEKVERILVIKWGKHGAEHLATYIVGDFTPSEVNSMFHF